MRIQCKTRTETDLPNLVDPAHQSFIDKAKQNIIQNQFALISRLTEKRRKICSKNLTVTLIYKSN